MIKYNIQNVSDWLYNSNPIKGMYYNGRRVYRRFVANGQPTPPVFDGKWKATYLDGRVTSAKCGSSSAIAQFEINKTNLVSVKIGDYCVTKINASAFKGYSSLTSCTIGSGVTDIGSMAFDGCSSLTSIDIPSGVTSIGIFTFRDCTSLQSIIVNATTPPTLKSSAFNNTNDCPIYVPSGSVNAYKTASGWSNYASRIQPIS